MKTHPLFNILLVVTALALLLGCRQEPQEPQVTQDEPAVTAGEEIQKELGEAASATGRYLDQSKDAVVAATREQLQGMDARIDELARKSEGHSDQARSEAEPLLAKLRAQRTEVAKQLEQLETASKETWLDVKAGLDVAWQELQKTYNEARNKLAD